jgi:hypothetical protein
MKYQWNVNKFCSGVVAGNCVDYVTADDKRLSFMISKFSSLYFITKVCGSLMFRFNDTISVQNAESACGLMYGI